MLLWAFLITTVYAYPRYQRQTEDNYRTHLYFYPRIPSSDDYTTALVTSEAAPQTFDGIEPLVTTTVPPEETTSFFTASGSNAENLKSLDKTVDIDGDGHLSLQEVQYAAFVHHGLSGSVVNDMFKQVDIDKDNYLSSVEFNNIRPLVIEKAENAAQHYLQTVDLDHNRMLSLPEAQAYLLREYGIGSRDVERIWKLVNPDVNAQMDAADFAKLRRRVRGMSIRLSRQIMKYADTNEDNHISLDEAQAIAFEQEGIGPDDVSEMMASVDDNQDGELNAPEFADFERIVRARAIETSKKALKVVDADGSGTLKLDEAKRIAFEHYGFDETVLAPFFDQADENEDGQLDAVEFAGFRSVIRNRAVSDAIPILKETDQNGDGLISLQEAAEKTKREDDLEEFETKALFDIADQNKSGKLDKVELADFVRLVRLSAIKFATDHFKEFDTNGDKIVTLEELAQLIETKYGVPIEITKKFFDKIDVDHSGELIPAEIVDFRHEIRKYVASLQPANSDESVNDEMKTPSSGKAEETTTDNSSSPSPDVTTTASIISSTTQQEQENLTTREKPLLFQIPPHKAKVSVSAIITREPSSESEHQKTADQQKQLITQPEITNLVLTSTTEVPPSHDAGLSQEEAVQVPIIKTDETIVQTKTEETTDTLETNAVPLKREDIDKTTVLAQSIHIIKLENIEKNADESQAIVSTTSTPDDLLMTTSEIPTTEEANTPEASTASETNIPEASTTFETETFTEATTEKSLESTIVNIVPIQNKPKKVPDALSVIEDLLPKGFNAVEAIHVPNVVVSNKEFEKALNGAPEQSENSNESNKNTNATISSTDNDYEVIAVEVDEKGNEISRRPVQDVDERRRLIEEQKRILNIPASAEVEYIEGDEALEMEEATGTHIKTSSNRKNKVPRGDTEVEIVEYADVDSSSSTTAAPPA